LPAALLGLARIDLSQGKNEEARRQLQAALSTEPDNPAANGELGSLDMEENNWTGANSHLSKAWSADQSNPNVAVRLARTLEHLNRTTDALRLLRPLATRLGDLPAFHLELAEIYTKLGKSIDAQNERQQLATLQAQSENSLRFEDPKTYAH
jgi:predicted Zn-dependent protease